MVKYRCKHCKGGLPEIGEAVAARAKEFERECAEKAKLLKEDESELVTVECGDELPCPECGRRYSFSQTFRQLVRGGSSNA